MNRKKKRTSRVLAGLLAAFFVFGACRVTAEALAFEDQIRGTKTAISLGGDGRSFRLDFKVWSGQTAEKAVEPCDVLLLVDTSPGMGEPAGVDGKSGPSRMEDTRAGLESFLRELRQVSPDFRVGLVPFCGSAGSAGPEKLDEKGLSNLLEKLGDLKPEASGKPDYEAALKRAGELAGRLGGDRPLYLITIASGLWEETDSAGPLTQLQALRDQGARSYTVLLCLSPGEETEEFWQSMSSLPLSTYHRVCGGDGENCLGEIRREIGSAFTAEVRQRLDPRFEIDAAEQKRLMSEGGHVIKERDGSFTVSWQADLPRKESAPWEASLTIRARENFPGGNDVSTDGEGTGLYRAGKLVAQLPAVKVNPALKLELGDCETKIFLGEKLKTMADGKNVEEQMGVARPSDWYGKGQTGAFSYLWESESGDPIGSLEQLAVLEPKRDTIYRLRTVYRPDSSGLGAAGEPVKETEWTALYRVEVVPGTIHIMAAGEDTALGRNTSLRFQVEREGERVSGCTARLEADPESGRLFLAGEVSGLPYGVYTVSPVPGSGPECLEKTQLCRLGVWEKDDTISAERARAQAGFTLGKP